VQLRGADWSSLEGDFPGPATAINAQNLTSTASAAAIQGYSNANLGNYPWWSPMSSWKLNAVRVPLNEASYLRTYTGKDVMNVGAGLQLPDNASATTSGQYRATVKKIVSDLNALGLYVILDLHWSAPGAYLGNTQMQLPDADHSPAFWTQMATDFGDNPAVIFDLFNEPYPTAVGSQSPYQVLLNGAQQTSLSFNSGKSPSPIAYTWTSAGMQSLVNAVRNAGGKNLIMVGGPNAAGDLSGFLTANGGYFPTDPLNNIAVSWHAYGVSSASSTVPNASYSAQVNPTTVAIGLLAQGLPIIIGETGGCAGSGCANPDPVTLYATQFADKYGISVLAWAWNNWDSANSAAQDLLILNAGGTPLNGEGTTYQNWTANHP
jgi:hypothetical protein